MTWLERLKALRPEGNGLPGHRQNRQNHGFVSFDSAQVVEVLTGETGDASMGEADEAAHEAVKERAAIMEYDGGLTRDEAEQLAGMAASEPQSRMRSRWRGEGLDLGDLRPCLWCRNLTRSGRCLAAWRGDLRASRDWEPTFPGQPSRCIGYLPSHDDPDQRPGHVRWPELMASQGRESPEAAGSAETISMLRSEVV